MRWKSFRVVATAAVVVSMLVILFAQFSSKPDNLLMATTAYADAGPKDTPEVIERFGCYPPKSVKCQSPPATVQQEVRRTLNRNGMGWAWPVAVYVIECESGWDPNQKTWDSNGKISWGLWQINEVHSWVDFSRITDPAYNTEVAIILYKSRGNWSDWHWCARFWNGALSP